MGDLKARCGMINWRQWLQISPWLHGVAVSRKGKAGGVVYDPLPLPGGTEAWSSEKSFLGGFHWMHIILPLGRRVTWDWDLMLCILWGYATHMPTCTCKMMLILFCPPGQRVPCRVYSHKVLTEYRVAHCLGVLVAWGGVEVDGIPPIDFVLLCGLLLLGGLCQHQSWQVVEWCLLTILYSKESDGEDAV